MVFKEIQSGIFRSKNGICYVKLPHPIEDDESSVNAVAVIGGTLTKFEDSDEVFEW